MVARTRPAPHGGGSGGGGSPGRGQRALLRRRGGAAGGARPRVRRRHLVSPACAAGCKYDLFPLSVASSLSLCLSVSLSFLSLASVLSNRAWSACCTSLWPLSPDPSCFCVRHAAVLRPRSHRLRARRCVARCARVPEYRPPAPGSRGSTASRAAIGTLAAPAAGARLAASNGPRHGVVRPQSCPA